MLSRTLIAFATLTAVALCAPAAFAAHYDIDPAHSSVAFKVRHLTTQVPGKFTQFAGSFEFDPKDSKLWKVDASIDAASIDTGTAKRDAHLKSPDFFDVGKCPKISFKSTGVKEVSDTSAKIEGDLTLHCVTKPVVLELTLNGTGKDPWGHETAGFSALTKVNRKDFGISWNKALDAGGLLLGDDVMIAIDVEGDKTDGKKK